MTILNVGTMADDLGMSESQLLEELGFIPPVQQESFASLKERALTAQPFSSERRYLFGLLAEYFLEETPERGRDTKTDEDDLFSFAKRLFAA